MTSDQTDLARRLVDAGYLRAGMWATHGSVLLSDAVLDGGVWRCRIIDPGDPGHVWTRIDPDETIDLTHPATIGIIEHLAREAWSTEAPPDQIAGCERVQSGCANPWRVWTNDRVPIAYGACRGSAWTEALLAAPGVSS